MTRIFQIDEKGSTGAKFCCINLYKGPPAQHLLQQNPAFLPRGAQSHVDIPLTHVSEFIKNKFGTEAKSRWKESGLGCNSVILEG